MVWEGGEGNRRGIFSGCSSSTLSRCPCLPADWLSVCALLMLCAG